MANPFFVDTLKQAFPAKKDLFEGLYIYNNWDWSKSYPVIHIDLGGGFLSTDPSYFENWPLQKLEENQKK